MGISCFFKGRKLKVENGKMKAEVSFSDFSIFFPIIKTVSL